jgi:type IV secretory pathway VirB2 component (pilin)
MKLQNQQTNLFFIILVLGLCTLPQWAIAAAAWDDALKTIVDYVTGSTARYIAILAVVGFGFAAFVGRK